MPYLYNIAIAVGMCYLIIEHDWSLWWWFLAIGMMAAPTEDKK